ncbi:MAG: winged helix-turn-helix domain-containing protein, partial [Candidatus Bathyarchaeia archaeon]
MERRTVDDKRLVAFLYGHNPSTIPKIAKALNVDPTTVRHHLEKLIEKGIVIKEEKRYGTKYHLNPKLTSIPLKFYVTLAIIYIPYIVALLLLPLQQYLT